MTNPSPSPKPQRPWGWIAAGVAAATLGLGLTFGTSGGPGGPSLSDSGYQIVDGTVMWRPMNQAERVAATVLTLGLAANSEAVQGRSLRSAKAGAFRAIGGQHGTDGTRVWYRGEQIEGADPGSFAVLERGFSRDATQVWKGAAHVLRLETDTEAKIEVHSEHIFSVGAQTWLATQPATALPERPLGQPVHYCRNWFSMNDAIWLGSRKVLSLDAPAMILDCDSTRLTRYENGIGREDISENTGLLLISGAAVWRLSLTDGVSEIGTLPEPAIETLLLGNGARDDETVLARAATGNIYALRPRDGATVQSLGRFDALPDNDTTFLGGSFLMGDRYFSLIGQFEPGGPTIIDHGPAKRYGDMVVADGTLFHGSRIIGRPGDLPLRLVRPATILVGPSCINFGNFVTDVPDTTAEASEITPGCQTMRRPDDILYDGVRIGFVPGIAELGPGETDPSLTLYRIGHLSFVNETDTPRVLTADFLEAFDVSVFGTTIAPPDDAWPAEGVTLTPGDRHQWPLRAQTTADPNTWAWTLKMRHNPAYAAVFGTEPFYIGSGQFSQ